MITKNEISSLNLSPTKKDFVQIWNELIEVASKITERWDPTSTNESDPGIVLLKVLTGIADKLNYNIDKNILEAFMPTAAQMESMRKLCELVGYDIKYYQSAETKVRISYTGSTTEEEEKLPEPGGLALPKFTTITNADKDITFVTTNTVPLLLSNDIPWVDVPCIEGQISQCESINENNLITLAQLDNNNRYYLPEIQIAENGIFVYNAAVDSLSDTYALVDGIAWEQVSNLNTRPRSSRVFKFGYDSFEGRPYLAFPDDVGSLIGDGLFIYFVRTSGVNGNISPRTLEMLELPTSNGWENYSTEQFEVVNVNATTNGANIESISAAYNNFKKTVGIFDTLITCRDYMNKIYSLMDMDNSPYVSNILVTDIRNDINKAYTLCSCNEFGILYKEAPITKYVEGLYATRNVKPVQVAGGFVNRLTIQNQPGFEEPLMDHFDLILYPFKTFTQVSPGIDNFAEPYNKSFTYTNQMNGEIRAALDNFKTCAHNLKDPDDGDIVAINNYLRLNAFIATSTKVSEMETTSIINNIKAALVNAFNLRNLDFGEEIPFDSILSVMEAADPRIKVVSLQEPTVLTTFSVKETVIGDDGTSTAMSKEYGIASSSKDEISGVYYGDESKTKKGETAKDIYNKLVLRNILAGRAALFDYDETFIPNNSEKPYTITKDITEDIKADDEYQGLINEINTKLEEGSGEYILDTKIGIYSSESTITLCVNDDSIKTRVDNASESDEDYDIASTINSVDITGLGQGYHVCSDITGFSGGLIVLLISMSEAGQNEISDIYERTYKVYETYEHIFNVTSKSRAVDNTGSSIINNIQRVEAACEITSSSLNAEGNVVFENITLGKNEVIKFRAPNLITTKTFPAYVYYRFEHGTDTENALAAGEYATALSLNSFINDIGGATQFFGGYYINNNEDRIDVTDKYAGLWVQNRDNLSSFKAEFMLEKLSVDEVKVLPITDKIDQRDQLPSIFRKAIACGTAARDTETFTITNVFLDENTLTSYIENAAAEAAKDWNLGETHRLELEFVYYPLKGATISAWSSYIQTCYYKKNNAYLPDTGTVLWRLSSTNSYPKGKLVIDSSQRLFAQDSKWLETPDSNVGADTYICTYSGVDPVFSSIDSGSDIELRAGDRLYIHYTPSSTNEDGETVNAEPISIVYEGGDVDNPVIIKPSGFTLIPSDSVNQQGTSWKKTDVDFNGSKKNLLALAPNEQIEMRSISKVVLSQPARFYKNFDNEGLEKGSIQNYELKDGEYIFYTDQNTQEAAYYGSGSVITLNGRARIPKATDKVEVSQILEKGLHIIPWSSPVLLDSNNTVTVTEYQYITLIEGDTLETLTINSEDSKAESYTLSNKKWTTCLSTTENPIKYTLAGEETSKELPKIDLSSGSSTSWEVCSFLELSTSPGYAQTLSATAVKKDKLKIHLMSDTGAAGEVEIEPQESVGSQNTSVFEPVSIKLNKIAQVASGNFEASKVTDTSKVPEPLQMKVFKEEPPSIVMLDNYDEVITPISEKRFESVPVDPSLTEINNYWTTLNVNTLLDFNSGEADPKPNALNINFMIPDDRDVFGIFSIYLDVPDYISTTKKHSIPEEGFRVFIDVPSEFKSYEQVISIFNYNETVSEINYSWWSDGVNGNRLYLKAGLNCIKILKSCNLLIKAEKSAVGSLLYDNLRLVKGINTHGINLALLDPDAQYNKKVELGTLDDAAGLANDILANIANIDKNHEFYYNVPIENSLAIEFDNNINSFSNPYTLYDKNNINNSFVISKLDIAYLDTGLNIAKSSRY